jgi:hypothetical protein
VIGDPVIGKCDNSRQIGMGWDTRGGGGVESPGSGRREISECRVPSLRELRAGGGNYFASFVPVI